MAIVRRTTLILCAAALLCAALLLPPAAQAYCVYNHTNVDLKVCGEQCAGCYSGVLKPGDHGCCPGDDKGCRGLTWITISVYYGDHSKCGNWTPPSRVEAHGWVSFHGTCKKDWSTCDRPGACPDLTAKIYSSDGHVTYSGPPDWRGDAGCRW